MNTNKKRALADVLDEAANEILLPNYSHGWRGYSCCAVALAADAKGAATNYGIARKHKAVRFLKTLGCDVDACRDMWPEFRDGPERQGVRYMWLLLAMHVAEDEGILV